MTEEAIPETREPLDNAPATPESRPKKKRGRFVLRLVIVLLACLIAAGSAVYAYFLFSCSPDAEPHIPAPAWDDGGPSFRGYHDALSPNQQELYGRFEQAIRNFEPFIPVLPGELSEKQVAEVFVSVLYDNPDIFWVHPRFHYIPWFDGGTAGIAPTYLFSDGEASVLHGKYMEETLGAVAELGLSSSELSDKEKARRIYNKVISNLEYGRNQHDQTVVAFFGEYAGGYATCAGYAATFKLLCDAAGLECYSPRGLLYGSDNAPHAWNMVRLSHPDDMGRDILFAETTWGDRDRDDGGIDELWCTTSGRFFENSHLPDELCSKMEIVRDGVEQTRRQDEHTEDLPDGVPASTDIIDCLRMEDVLRMTPGGARLSPGEWQEIFDEDEDVQEELLG